MAKQLYVLACGNDVRALTIAGGLQAL